MYGFVILSLLLAPAALPSGKSAPEKPDKIVCKSTHVLGSNLSHRLCKTKGQWNEDRKRAREYLDLAPPNASLPSNANNPPP